MRRGRVITVREFWYLQRAKYEALTVAALILEADQLTAKLDAVLEEERLSEHVQSMPATMRAKWMKDFEELACDTDRRKRNLIERIIRSKQAAPEPQA